MRTVFLDLEGTVLKSWNNPLLMNTLKVRRFLEAHDAKEFRLFSFAVWNSDDVQTFNQEVKPRLEDALDATCLDCPTVKDFMCSDTRVTGMDWFDMHEFLLTRGKMDAFRSWVADKFFMCDCLLVDDVVKNVTILNRDTGFVTEFHNVKNLK